MTIKERLNKLRTAMMKADIDCFMIPTSDFHDSEYVSEHFMARNYFSGFTGSAGTLIVTQTHAALFTDGRYFIQAQNELAGSGIILMRSGEPGVLTIKEYVDQMLKQHHNLGFDGRMITAHAGKEFVEIVKKKNGRVIYDQDILTEAWENRPALKHEPVFILPEIYSGESVGQKLIRLREKMKEQQAQVHVLSTLDDIAWLFNIRGEDIAYCPVVLSYAVITMEDVFLFAGTEAVNGEAAAYFKENNVTLRPYEEIDTYMASIPEQHKIWVCGKRISHSLFNRINRQAELLDLESPITAMKAVKNSVEIENLRRAHVKDAVAMTRFMIWIKENKNIGNETELTVADYLMRLRKEQEHFIGLSFETISAFKDHGAIIHYSASPESCYRLKGSGLLMVDSGGHYLEGSTDITRTYVIGSITPEMKHHYTLVVRAMLKLENACFLYGCCGANLDMLARSVFWEEKLDYKHGTGHGVGYLLNVHEGPNSFRWKVQGGGAILEAGMVTTDEPGLYIEGSHGIRIENELLCRFDELNEYGQFMSFEDLTCVPIDLEGLNTDEMEPDDIKRLNHYHRKVFERLSPFFEGADRERLAHYTREVSLK